MQDVAASAQGKNTEYTALKSANPYNILCVGIEKASVNKISTNSFKKDNFPVSVYLMPFLRICLCKVQENETNL